MDQEEKGGLEEDNKLKDGKMYDKEQEGDDGWRGGGVTEKVKAAVRKIFRKRRERSRYGRREIRKMKYCKKETWTERKYRQQIHLFLGLFPLISHPRRHKDL